MIEHLESEGGSHAVPTGCQTPSRMMHMTPRQHVIGARRASTNMQFHTDQQKSLVCASTAVPFLIWIAVALDVSCEICLECGGHSKCLGTNQ